MIIWLASYPRSGNTLLRTMLFQCFGLNTYDMDRTKKPNNPKVKTIANSKHITGTIRYNDPNWETFYRRASESDSTYLIKTHLHPFDQHPAIYVRRDGRSACLSYLKFFQSRFPEVGRTLNQIISGDDFYGGWSDHYRAWNKTHTGPVLVLDFEELVSADQSVLKRIADFIGHTGEIKPWNNPRAELNKISPWFFGDGAIDWQPTEQWKKEHDLLFYTKHSELMIELGFYSNEELKILKSSDITEETLKKMKTKKLSLLRKMWRLLFKIIMKTRHVIRRILGPHIGLLDQYSPRALRVPKEHKQIGELKQSPSISIVTASLNQAEFIERTIESVLSQNYPALEYILRDGGSDDGTLDILQKYDQQILSWSSRSDNGQTDALNQGFQNTSGEIMAYLNSDDLLLPGTLHYIAAFFQRYPDVDVVYGHRVLIDENDNDIGKWIMPAHEDDVLRWVDYVPQETLFWRRSLWNKVGSQLDDSFNFAMDWDLLLRFTEVGAKFQRLPRFLGAFRVHPQQKTSSVMHSLGQDEIARLHQRCHGRKLNRREIRKNTAIYLLKQVAYDKWVRLNRFFQKKTVIKHTR